MRSAILGLAACTVLGAVPVPAVAQPDPIIGSWHGGGTAKPANGQAEPVRCRVTYSASVGRSFELSANCAHAAGAFEQRGRVVSLGGNRYTGRIYNQQYNATGEVSVSLRGRQQVVTVTSELGTANMTLNKR